MRLSGLCEGGGRGEGLWCARSGMNGEEAFDGALMFFSSEVECFKNVKAIQAQLKSVECKITLLYFIYFYKKHIEFHSLITLEAAFHIQ